MNERTPRLSCLLTLQGVWHLLDSKVFLFLPFPTQSCIVWPSWSQYTNMYIGLHWKPVHSIFGFQTLQFYQLFFLCFGIFFCKLDHCASNFASNTVDWVAHLSHGDGPGTMPQEGGNLISLQPKPSCQATALRRLEAPGKQRKGTKPVFINLLQICLCWFLQVSVSENKEPQTSVIDGLNSNVLISTIWLHVKSSQSCPKKAV